VIFQPFVALAVAAITAITAITTRANHRGRLCLTDEVLPG
jgi:hypothetical protein